MDRDWKMIPQEWRLITLGNGFSSTFGDSRDHKYSCILKQGGLGLGVSEEKVLKCYAEL